VISKKRPEKPRRAIRASAKEPSIGLIALHETNLALAIGAGFVGPRFEKAAAIDSHTAAGHVVLSQKAGEAEFSGARGDLAYGVTVLLEVDTSRVQSSHGDELLFVPVSAVTQVKFPSQASLDDFKARLSGFGDVPGDILAMSAAPDEFGGDRGSRTADLIADNRAQKEARRLDAFAGAIAAMVAAGSIVGSWAAAEALGRVASEAFPTGDFRTTLDAVIRFLDPGSASSGAIDLLVPILSTLDEKHEAEGFDARSLIKAVRGRLQDQAAEDDAQLGKVLTAADDVIALRRDLSDGAFQEGDGLVIQRAFLLFLLNPDPDRLEALPRRVGNLGARVFVTASAFVGYAVGFSRLPKGLKAINRDAYLGVSEFAWHARRGSLRAEVRSTWLPDGSRNRELVLAGFRVSSTKEQPEKQVATALALLTTEGYMPDVDQVSGQVSFERILATGEKVRILVAGSESPTFPPRDCVRLSLRRAGFKSSKEAAAAVARIPTGGKVFACAEASKHRAVEYWVYCLLPLEKQALEEAVTNLVRSIPSPSEKAPYAAEQQDIFAAAPDRSPDSSEAAAEH
jgi:hypothetical protein